MATKDTKKALLKIAAKAGARQRVSSTPQLGNISNAVNMIRSINKKESTGKGTYRKEVK